MYIGTTITPSQIKIGPYPNRTYTQFIDIHRQYFLCRVQGSIHTHTHFHIIKEGGVILTGKNNKATGLWRVPLENINPQIYIEHRINSAYHMTNQTDLLKYLHAAAFSPFKLTYIREIRKRYLQSWSGLALQLVTKYLPNSVSTSKGHIDQA